MSRQERIKLIHAIEDHRKSHVICCLTSDRQNAPGIIAKDFIPIFFEHLRTFQDHERVDVLMVTTGGDTLAAFGLSRLLREFSRSIGTLVPEKCQSAGTLFALGANDIFMARAATLTPIDPSVNSMFNPVVEVAPGQRINVPVSVESVAGYKALVTEEWKLSKQAAGDAFRMLVEKINPLALGGVYRSRQQIERLARSLLDNHRKDEPQINKIVEMLTRGFGSHDYLISRGEARELLGEQVAKDDRKLESLIWDLYLDFSAEMQLGKIFDAGMLVHSASISAGRPVPVVDEQKVVVIETTVRGDEFERVFQLAPTQTITPAGPMQSVQQSLVRAGWKQYD